MAFRQRLQNILIGTTISGVAFLLATNEVGLFVCLSPTYLLSLLCCEEELKKLSPNRLFLFCFCVYLYVYTFFFFFLLFFFFSSASAAAIFYSFLVPRVVFDSHHGLYVLSYPYNQLSKATSMVERHVVSLRSGVRGENIALPETKPLLLSEEENSKRNTRFVQTLKSDYVSGWNHTVQCAHNKIISSLDV